jgi:hypothetical protein
MLLSRHQNAGQNHNIKIANRSFENVAQFRYFGTVVTNQILVLEEIRSLNLGNACYDSVQNLLYSCLLSKHIIIRIDKIIILLPVVLFGCETWCLSSREEHRLRTFENRVLRRILA